MERENSKQDKWALVKYLSKKKILEEGAQMTEEALMLGKEKVQPQQIENLLLLVAQNQRTVKKYKVLMIQKNKLRLRLLIMGKNKKK